MLTIPDHIAALSPDLAKAQKSLRDMDAQMIECQRLIAELEGKASRPITVDAGRDAQETLRAVAALPEQIAETAQAATDLDRERQHLERLRALRSRLDGQLRAAIATEVAPHYGRKTAEATAVLDSIEARIGKALDAVRADFVKAITLGAEAGTLGSWCDSPGSPLGYGGPLEWITLALHRARERFVADLARTA